MLEKREIINKLEPYVPGKSKNDIAEAYGINPDDIIKLGSNENPLGPSPMAVEAIKNEVENINRYPESNHEELKEEIAKYSGVRPDQVIIGGDGADELIEILGKTYIDKGFEFVVPLPTYMYYEFTLQNFEAKASYGIWDIEHNRLDVDSILAAINKKTRLVFLCTPNNPTGGLISQEDLRRILDATDALVIVDEAYFEFSETNNVNLLDEYDNLFILRTFSKVMGLAGMRIGYGLSNPEVIENMHRSKPVFSLTKLSYIAALATIKDTEYIEKSTEYSINEREYLFEEISKIPELKIFPSKSNYLLIDTNDSGMVATELANELLKKGVIVRDCTSFKGLDEFWIRISVATHSENERFIRILKDILANHKK